MKEPTKRLMHQNVMRMKAAAITKLSLTKQNIFLKDKTYDYSLPQPWVDRLNSTYNVGYRNIISSFVWLYDEKAKFFGRPYPINMTGWVIAKIIDVEW